MNVYEVDIWCSVKHSGVFSHTSTRTELIHALSEDRARNKVILSEAKIMGSEPHLVEASSEFIYSIIKTGTVTKQMYYEYSNGRPPRPVRMVK